MTEQRYPYQPTEVSPPGETLRELMEEHGLNQTMLAERLNRPVQAVNEILAGKKEVTEDTALELERVFKMPARFWMAREARYREYLARLRAADSLASEVPWVERFPLKALQQMGVLPAGKLTAGFKRDLVEPLRRFFGVASSAGWQSYYGERLQASFRRARPKQQTDVAAISAWLRLGELAAQAQELPPYDATQLEAALPALRALTLRPAGEIGPALQKICGAAGVHLAFVPALPGTEVSGVARWLPTGHPLVQLSLRGKWNDIFWFSFFHELGHVLKHPKRAIYLDDGSASHPDESAEEREANDFARNCLIPPPHQAVLEGLPLEVASIREFARQIGIHPGVVVGQLQKRGRIGYASALTKLKARYELAA